MNRALLATVFCLASMIAIGSAHGETAAIHSQIQDTQSIPLERSSTAQAATWGLSEQEWSRFEQIQAGPRGFWSPNLDPLTALGVEAETDQERQRYAELQVTLEAKRAERELAYQNAYTAAWASCFPGCCRSRAWRPCPLPAHPSHLAQPYSWRTNANRVSPKRCACKAVTQRSTSTWWAAKARMNRSAPGRGKQASTRLGFNADRSP